jgi:hypothetical protein
MIDKRKLIREILRYNPSENSFYDLKLDINFADFKEKTKFLKHISGLSNSNPENPSFLIFGVENETRKVVGLNWLDDATFQNIIRSNLNNPPSILYDNVIFPDLPHDRFVGLLTIYPQKEPVSFKTKMLKYPKGAKFYRVGSQTLLEDELSSVKLPNKKELIEKIQNLSRISLSAMIGEVLKFYKDTSPSYCPSHVVFNDQFVICYSYWPEHNFDEKDLICEVTITLPTENVLLFISAVDYAKIKVTDKSFIVSKMAHLYFNKKPNFIPFIETAFIFETNSDYKIEKRLVFRVPKIRKKDAISIIKRYKEFLSNYQFLSEIERLGPAETLCDELLICALNGYSEAEDLFLNYLNGEADGCVAEAYTKAKIVYDSQNLKNSNSAIDHRDMNTGT